MKLLIGLMVLLLVGIFTGHLDEFRDDIAMIRSERRLARQERELSEKQAQSERERIRNYRKEYNFELLPGEPRKIPTRGDDVDMTFHGETIVVYHVGASKEWIRTKGSDVFYTYQNKLAEVQAITFIRPYHSYGPLGYSVVCSYNPQNKQKERGEY